MSGIKRVAREIGERVAPNLALFGHDIFADLKRRKTGFDPRIIFDVGANIGETASEFCRRFDRVKVYAFEPGSENHAKLVENTSGMPVECVKLGLGSETRTAAFVHDPDRPKMSHVVDAEDGDAEVEIVRLDDFAAQSGVERISYLKVDTEGFDLEVLRGASNMLEAGAIDFVEVEAGINPDNTYHVPLTDFMAYLQPLGYMIFGFYEQTQEWTTKSPWLRRANVVFMRSRNA